ncbi:ornithine cyclodeaminase [Candidimonas nitroreducens]|uniref:Ornithine cyclodeaminase n=1 Tax=Candidimonas nitroreducens TaxID=683354 RepID=A0A225M7K5_9BURK|nr:ornithine cyclodeaminase [Candidimonas nitroreducens]OWT56223.1 ornithine cyclodeaminase [Candidimonas nitroreducens]
MRHTGSSSPLQTLFLDSGDIAAMVRRKGLDACFEGLEAALRADFLRWNEFDKSARVARYGPQGVIELMPIADASTYGFKYVNGHPGNTRLGLPTVSACGVLASMRTGVPELLSELTLTTALRTAATSAMAARILARPGSRSMALIGNGAQAEFQAQAFRSLLGLRELRLYDIDPAATAKLQRNLAGSGLRLQVCGSVREAVRGADIVTTLTAHNGHATVLRADMLEPGMHVNAVGGDSPGKTELEPAALRRGPVFVEFEPQTRVEGELQQLPPDFPATELWTVLAGLAPGRGDARQITLFDSVGFALEDYSALRFMRDLARELGAGRPVRLVPDMADPKDLYSCLALPASVQAPVAPLEELLQ